jgi:hypothetical protein
MKRTLIVFGLMMAFTQSASAYVGPGMGLGALGVLVGLISTVALAVVGLVWYPLKRAFKSKSDVAEEEAIEDEDVAGEKQEENAVS